MTAMFEVQKGVPLPAIDRSPKRPRRTYPIEGMNIGEMFFMPGRSSKSVSAYLSRVSKGGAGKFSARHCWMRKVRSARGYGWALCEPTESGATEGVGVWRIE